MEAINLPKSLPLEYGTDECVLWMGSSGFYFLCRLVTIILEIAHLLSTDFVIQSTRCVSGNNTKNSIDRRRGIFQYAPTDLLQLKSKLVSLGEFFISGTHHTVLPPKQ